MDINLDMNMDLDNEYMKNIMVIIINFMDNAINSATIYSKHCNRNAVVKEDIKRAFMMEVFLMKKRGDTLEKCEAIKEVIENINDTTEDNLVNQDEEDYQEPEDEFCESECDCGICKFMNVIYDKWEHFRPETEIEKILEKVLYDNIEKL